MDLNYNNDKASIQRNGSIELNMGEVEKVVSFLKSIAANDYEQSLIQRMIYDYENLSNYRDRTVGFWATEFPEEIIVPNDNKKVIGEITIPYLFKLEY